MRKDFGKVAFCGVSNEFAGAGHLLFEAEVFS
jgi:hypothetical protein